MKLHSLRIEGFRRHIDTEILFSDATFLIGQNNIGKSSILHALNYLLSDTKKIPEEEFNCVTLEDGTTTILSNEVILTAEFRNVSEEALKWPGFKGRVLKYEPANGLDDTGLKIIYRKHFKPGSNYTVELRQYNKIRLEQYADCSTLNDFREAGLDEEIINNIDYDPNKKLTATQLKKVWEIDDLYEVDESEEMWFANPGGIPGVVLHRLPKFILIPAQDKEDELSGTNGSLRQTLNTLFNDVRDSSENFIKAQEHLNLLAKELDPSDKESEFGIMMAELNDVLTGVFSDIEIKTETVLSEADKSIKPQFNITLQSNVQTPVSLQGTGVIRSAVFALLRYRTIREIKNTSTSRPIIIGFEEPEIYLHPNAANQMRETIYELASYDLNQIICTTHSPYMIDLSKKPNQILNNLIGESRTVKLNDAEIEVEQIIANPFSTSLAFKYLQDSEKDYVKMLLKIDDYISRIFFTKNVLIIEGDTEELVLRETITRLPAPIKRDILHNWQIIKARGKAVIISLVKYLKACGIDPHVLHDRDHGTERAQQFNKPIKDSVGNPNSVFLLEECIENVLGYDPPAAEKPYTAYKFILENWGDDWSSVSANWKDIVEQIFASSFSIHESREEQLTLSK